MDEFKEFLKTIPSIKQDVLNGRYTWQQLYEIYVMYGKDDKFWQPYKTNGNLNLNALAGPVGIFGIVGTAADAGIWSVLSLIALLSVNVGFINLLPLPAFDGGRLLFIIIEKIKGKPVDPRLENTIHAVGFFLLMALMLLITYNDIIRLIK